MDDQERRKTYVSEWFQNLRDRICWTFEKIEQEHASKNPELIPGTFTLTPWSRPGGGGGTIGLMKGCVFEKVGVNISMVSGELSPLFQKEIQGAENDPQFWATGLSLVAHMQSPLIPAIHMNTRYIITTKQWFGGGIDLTPYILFEEDTRTFHESLKCLCDRYNKDYYPRFKKWCDEYFYLPHRKEARGVGGIFYDHLDTNDWQKDFSFTQDVGNTFLKIYPELISRHIDKSWTLEQRKHQLKCRGRYVEFNLLYDRGTRFGLQTEGNIDAILMSLPPEVIWP